MKTLICKITIIISLTFYACNVEKQNSNSEYLKNEILNIEKEFENTVRVEGMAAAFIHFADEAAVLNRNNKLIKGRKEIADYFSKQSLKDIKLEWTPDFIDVSNSGDLAYTYGSFTFEAITEKGDTISSNGIFHTVWKKQEDGSWKYVWD